MRRYLLRALLAHLGSGRALFALAVGGVALGVGAVLSIQILSQSALGTFTASVRALSGDAALSVVGRGPTLPDDVLPEVLGTPGVAAARPLLRVDLALEGERGAALEVAGVDLFAAAARGVAWELPRAALADVLAVPGWVAVSPELARERGWAPGTRLAASLGSRRVALQVGALVDFRRAAPLASRRLAVMDLAQAQALFGQAGRITELDVVARHGADAGELARRLEARLGPGFRAVTPEQRAAEAGALLAAFRLNLTALSAVSLLVGGFLVFAAIQAALSRRREELGLLRCLGATRGQVLGLVLADALALGALGTAAGIPLGWAAARANMGAVSATLRSLYFLEGVERVALGPGLIALGAALGLSGALAGALVPALDVAREDPRALLSRRAEPRPGRTPARLAALGAALLAAGAALALGPLRAWPYAGFALALAVLAAAPLAAPLALRAAGRLPPPRRLGAAFGGRDLSAHLRESAVPAGALAVAVAMLAGITVMIGSFRRTLEDWLSATLRADVYVTSPSWRRGRADAALAPEVVAALAAFPGVRRLEPLRQVPAEVAGRRVPVSGFDAVPEAARGRVQLLSGDAAAALARVAGEGEVLVSEPLARKAGIRPGDAVAIRFLAPGAPEEGAPRRYRVAALYRDYGNEGGAVMMDLAALARAAGPGPLTHVALDLAPGADPERAVERLRAALAPEAVVVRSNRTLRAEALAVFDRTFAVTRLLQGMSLVVAVAGVALALLVLGRERAAEVALLRALGATRGQVFRLFLGRALGIAAAGLALGALGGAGLALVLVEVVNPAWFGWSLALHWPWATLLAQAAVLLAAAAAAGLYPAARASRAPAAELSRDAL